MQDDTRSRLHGQCMIMPVPNFDWLEFKERVHPLLLAGGHSSTSITSGKIVIYCIKLFKKFLIITTMWFPDGRSSRSTKVKVKTNHIFSILHFSYNYCFILCPGSFRPDSRLPRFSNHRLINKAVYLVNYNFIQL